MSDPFGINKKDDSKKKEVAVGTAGVAGVAGASRLKVPEHSHYDKKTRKYLNSLKPGLHEVDTEMLTKKPRKLGARKQQTPYVAAMAQERPQPYSPVPITRYKGDKGVIQRDNAHSVMANTMKGRKTLINIEDAPGHRPVRPAGEELVRRAQSRYQEARLKRNTNLPESKIEAQRSKYTAKARTKNTTKRPHGVVESGFKMSRHKYGAKVALGILKKDQRKRDQAAGVSATAGVGALAATPVRRSAEAVKIKNGSISAADARKVASPGYRPGNKKAIRGMARNLKNLEDKPTTLIRYKDGKAIPFDGNHRMTARVARGDKRVPVNVIEGGERPAVSVTRNAFHVGQQRLHRRRMDKGTFNPTAKTGAHAGQTKMYGKMANASSSRSARRVAVSSTKSGAGPTKAVLRTKQGVALTAGVGLLGAAGVLSREKKR